MKRAGKCNFCQGTVSIVNLIRRRVGLYCKWKRFVTRRKCSRCPRRQKTYRYCHSHYRRERRLIFYIRKGCYRCVRRMKRYFKNITCRKVKPVAFRCNKRTCRRRIRFTYFFKRNCRCIRRYKNKFTRCCMLFACHKIVL